jgi:hypothetical protein
MGGEIGVRDDGFIMVTIIVFRCACSKFSTQDTVFFLRDAASREFQYSMVVRDSSSSLQVDYEVNSY